ncbi:hypothetical protein ACFFI0_21995, partial [Olivibacter oleidegradans]
PNREVKPARADGTAVTCGRVGRCRSLQKAAVHCTAAFLIISLPKTKRAVESKTRIPPYCIIIVKNIDLPFYVLGNGYMTLIKER